jgi:hypothetical protein
VAIIQAMRKSQLISEDVYHQAYLSLEVLSKMISGLLRTVAEESA